MVLLREEQIKHRVGETAMQVADQLVEYANPYTPGSSLKKRGLIEGFGLDFFTPPTVASRYTTAEIQKRFLRTFQLNDLKGVSFEFGIATLGPLGNNIFEKTSPRFFKVYEDTAHNYSVVRGLRDPSSAGFMGEAIGVSELLIVVVPGIKDIVVRSLRWNIAASILFTLAILAAFYFTIRTMIQQKKISEMKTDFINNMTHEFKTPLATISLAVDALKNEKLKEDHEKRAYFTNIIKDENKRMNKQVETILQAAQMDRQEVQLNTKTLHVHGVIQKALDNLSLQIQEKNGTVSLQLSAGNDLMEADEMHLTNLVSNLLDNAVKYAGNELFIRISTRNPSRHSIRIAVEDKGIGMTKETVGRIFEKFYRAHTGNLHNVKGFGLGLSYVKTMVEAHRGKIKVESVPGKGSTFTIDFPLIKAS